MHAWLWQAASSIHGPALGWPSRLLHCGIHPRGHDALRPAPLMAPGVLKALWADACKLPLCLAPQLQVGIKVRELQAQLPKARVVYCSATGASGAAT